MRLLAVLALMGVLTSCGGNDERAAPPDRAPDCAGPASLVTDTAVRVDEGTGVLSAVQARVDDATEILRRAGEDYEAATLDDVHIGDLVEVWVDGPVAESHPAQAHAEAVVLAS